MGSRRRAVLLLALAAAALHLAVVASFTPDARDIPSTYLYPKAHAIADGQAPYGEVPYEYPPATLPLLLAPLAFGGDGPVPYHRRTIWLYALVDLAIIAVLARSLRRDPRAVAVALIAWSVCVLVLGRLAFTRFDLAVGLAVLGAGLSVARPVRAAALLGVAGALKAAPLAGVAALRPRGRAGWAAVVAAALAVPLAAQLAVLVLTGDPGVGWLDDQGGRGVQVESWAAVTADVARGLGASVGHVYRDTTDSLTGTTADVLLRLSQLAALAWLVLFAVWAARRRVSGTAEALLALLGGLVVLSPVLSPQFLLWLAPLAAWLAPRLPIQAALLAATCVVTRLEVSLAYDDLRTFDAGAVTLVAARNVLLVAWLVVLVVDVRALRPTARAT